MQTLKAEGRNAGLKPKQLRRQGIVPGVLYGKNLEQSLSIQLSQRDVTRFLKSNTVGSKVNLELSGEKYSVLLKEREDDLSTGGTEHLSFQTLIAGEVIASSAKIILLNREKVSGIVQQALAEIQFRALPAHLTDRVEVDLEGMEIGATVYVSDLDIAKNDEIELLIPAYTLVFSITDSRKMELDDKQEEGGGEQEESAPAEAE